jgi:hypothetical protein
VRRPGLFAYLACLTKEVAVMKTVRSVAGLRRPALPALALTVICLGTALSAPAAALYELDADSSYQEGCFDPCACPIMMNDTLRGTFVLSPAGGDGVTSVFAVTDVAWHYRRGDELVPVTGSGSYTPGPDGHRLELDLVAGDAAPRHFDSGLVAPIVKFPQIDIAAAVNGFFCYDYVFAISASTGSVISGQPTWGALKATYR